MKLILNVEALLDLVPNQNSAAMTDIVLPIPRFVMEPFNVLTDWTKLNVISINVLKVIHFKRNIKYLKIKGTMQCDDGVCIPAHKWCDRRRDCANASDEKNCGHVSRRPCSPFEFECSNSVCIGRKFMCDGDNGEPFQHYFFL